MIQILCFSISQMCGETYEAFYARASRERRQRADRYLRREDKLRCVAADALLRYALGTAEWEVERDPSGKPRIKGREDFHYNLSHSGSWVVLAYGSREAGVDVERISMDAGKEKIARRYFTPEEQAYIFAEKEQAPYRFCQVWTGKESYLKYLGTGLRKPLGSFSVLSLPVPLHSWTLDGGYVLTLCAEGCFGEPTVLTAGQLLLE